MDDGRPQPEHQLAAVYDAFHTARASTGLVAQLYEEAMGDAYPHEVNASSSCDWPLLATLITRLRLRPAHQLVDLGCGTGGIGLWLARAFGTRLTGIDISPRAISLATGRGPQFLPPHRAEFHTATLEATGLPDGHADGAICIDAYSRAVDPRRALGEMRRILRPGGRMVLTSAGRHPITPPWPERAALAGLELEAEDERPDEPAMWRRLYGPWVEREADLRRELGDAQADSMISEARRRSPGLRLRRAVAVTLRRPQEAERPPYATP